MPQPRRDSIRLLEGLINEALRGDSIDFDEVAALSKSLTRQVFLGLQVFSSARWAEEFIATSFRKAVDGERDPLRFDVLYEEISLYLKNKGIVYFEDISTNSDTGWPFTSPKEDTTEAVQHLDRLYELVDTIRFAGDIDAVATHPFFRAAPWILYTAKLLQRRAPDHIRLAAPSVLWSDRADLPEYADLSAFEFCLALYGDRIDGGFTTEDLRKIDPVLANELFRRSPLPTYEQWIDGQLSRIGMPVKQVMLVEGFRDLFARAAEQQAVPRLTGERLVNWHLDKIQEIFAARSDPDLIGTFRSHAISRSLLNQKILPQLPDEERLAPPRLLWKDRNTSTSHAGMSPVEFAKDMYRDRLGKGFTKADLRKVDPGLSTALKGYMRPSKYGRDSATPELDLPTLDEWHDRQLAALGLKDLIANPLFRSILNAAANRSRLT